MALTDKLSAIGVAIREKTGKSDLLTLDQMPTEIASISGGSDPIIEALAITSNGTYTATNCDGYSPITVNVPQDGAPTAEDLTFTGSCSYLFAGGNWDWVINKHGNSIKLTQATDFDYMFKSSTVESIPFEISGDLNYNHNTERMFFYCSNLKELPKMTNMKPFNITSMFMSCNTLRYIPDDYGADWDWSRITEATSSYTGQNSSLFNSCTSLRKVPKTLVSIGNPYVNYSYSLYSNGFTDCSSLDEIVDLPVPYTMTIWTSNAFNNTVKNCYRLKNFTFALNPSTNAPYVQKWKSQLIDFTHVGYDYSNANTADDYFVRTTNILQFNSGITSDKHVKDDATYQALKNDPDWFTQYTAYSRYNHDSAVATINSLPDTSAYLATQGSSATNTIKFKGDAGSATDGGAINTLTQEEIAVAAAKGWTVTLA